MSDTIKLRLWQMAATDAAVKFSKTPPDRVPDEVWIPRSQIEHITRRPAALGVWPECEVTIEEWIAEKKGLL